MAATTAAVVSAEPPTEIPLWLKTLPLAPEYHPTPAEFEDPISYILKIEKEASKYGICKIVPPVPSPPKKTAIANLNRSLAARNPSLNPKSSPTFTTRHQQIGFCPRKPRPVQKPVWQSGENYTLQQFEAKAKHFEKTYLKKSGKKGFSALEIETLFWKASVDKPFTVEYANDMPGSAFVPINGKKLREAGETATVGETAWNMRGVSRAKGSLLRFMKEEIPGVTSPMVYIAMLFSWFAWHVEDHDLHSLNYMHMGAGKTWYGVPRDGLVAFEEVVRVNGYGGEVNPLVTFATLGEKTTVMSPEVLIGAGIPCCRLVQNVGEFVVTFPGAYHSGFSHGFNCGEAANIATPEWLMVAKEAAIRRASINYPPMVSHLQLLYALALNLCSRVPTSTGTEPRSSRLKDKKRGEGEAMIKELFVQNVIQNNDLLHVILECGSSCVLLPQNPSEISECTNLHVGSLIKIKPRLSLGLCSNKEELEASRILLSDDIMLDRNERLRHLSGIHSVKGKSKSMFEGGRLATLSGKYDQCGNDDLCKSFSLIPDTDTERGSASPGGGLLDQGLFSCVMCGVLSFSCAAVIQPKKAAARYFMSADCSFINDWDGDSRIPDDRYTVANENENAFELNYNSGRMQKSYQDGLYDVPVQSGNYQVQMAEQTVELVPASDAVAQKGISSLDLLAFAYGNSSDSDEEHVEPEMPVSADENDIGDCSPLSNQKLSRSKYLCDDSSLHSVEEEHQDGAAGTIVHSLSRLGCGNEVPIEISRCTSPNKKHGWTSSNVKCKSQQNLDFSLESNLETPVPVESNCLTGSCRDTVVKTGRVISGSSEVHHSDVRMERIECGAADYSIPSNSSRAISNCFPADAFCETTKSSNFDILLEDSSRKHIFCLEHAVEVEKQLRPIGGVHMLLLCHPEYPKVEAEAKSLADELGIDHLWKDIVFREATREDRDRIRSALDDEEVIPGTDDWAVKLGINLYYSANLSRLPLYTKQMPYNSIIYKAFGCSPPSNSPVKSEVSWKGSSRQKKIVVAGKWCGKVWMSNQVHPYLAQREIQEENSISFCARVTPNLKLERKADTGCKAEQLLLPEKNFSRVTATIDGKLGQKSKKTFEGATKRSKRPNPDNSIEAADVSSENNFSPLCRRILRSGQTKYQRLLHSNGVKNIMRYDSILKDEFEGGPSTRLRRRKSKLAEEFEVKPMGEKHGRKKKEKKAATSRNDLKDEEAEYQCDMDGCTMGFSTKQELVLHKRNICSVKGCGKKFFSHKYLVQHRRVHMDDRPLKCPWKGCKMTFKWAWARTEHIRVHTGARPYVCCEPGCGQTFRFVSDFSRHKRKTGHSVRGKE